jgi:hypothetical protein
MVSKWLKLKSLPHVEEWEHKNGDFRISLVNVDAVTKKRNAGIRKFFVQWYKKAFSGSWTPQGGRYFPNKLEASTFVKDYKKKINELYL